MTATFAAAGGLLRVVGDALDNTVVISRTAAGTILVNNGAVVIQGDPGASVANTLAIMISGAGGNDNLSVSEANGPMPPGSIFGGDGNDVLSGASRSDFIDGGLGNDSVFLGAGDDTFVWNPGDGSDVVEGQGGRDTLVFNGSDLAEKFAISDSGTGVPFHRVRLTRDVGGVTMDLNGIEVIDVNALGGADTITVNDQTATDLFLVNLNLNSSAGHGDSQADAVILNGTAGDDAVQIAAFDNGTNVVVGGLFPTLTITGEEGANDHLTVNTLGGNDVVDASSLPANLIGLTVNLGDGQPAPRVAAVVVNDGAAQRSMVTRIRVTFDQHVTLPANPAAAFRLVRQGDGAVVTLSATVDDTSSGTVLTLTFVGGAVNGSSLADGRYTLTVLAAQVGGLNGPLDGDGNGLGGDDFILAGNSATRLFRLFGDATGDGVVDLLDLGQFRGTFNAAAGSPTYLAFLDADGNGVVDLLDLGQFRSRFNASVF